ERAKESRHPAPPPPSQRPKAVERLGLGGGTKQEAPHASPDQERLGIGRPHQGRLPVPPRQRVRGGRPRGPDLPARRGGLPHASAGGQRGGAGGVAAAGGGPESDDRPEAADPRLNGVLPGPGGPGRGSGREERDVRGAPDTRGAGRVGGQALDRVRGSAAGNRGRPTPPSP